MTPEQITEGIRTAVHRLEETTKIFERIEERFSEGNATAAEFKRAWEDHQRAKIEAARAHQAWRAADAERQRRAIAEANG